MKRKIPEIIIESCVECPKRYIGKSMSFCCSANYCKGDDAFTNECPLESVQPEKCPECYGNKKFISTCPTCKGTGEVKKQ